MNKEKLVSAIAKESGLTKIKTRIFLEAMIKIMKSTLVNGNKIVIQDFGTFKVVERKPRNIRNAHTGELMHAEGHKTVKFDIGKELKREMNA